MRLKLPFSDDACRVDPQLLRYLTVTIEHDDDRAEHSGFLDSATRLLD